MAEDALSGSLHAPSGRRFVGSFGLGRDDRRIGLFTARLKSCPDTNRFATVLNPTRMKKQSTGRSASTPPRETRGRDPGAGAHARCRDCSNATPAESSGFFYLGQMLQENVRLAPLKG